MSKMASLLVKQGKQEQAERLFREAVLRAKSSPSLGSKHPTTKQLAANHANCLDALGRLEEAAALRKEFDLPAPTTVPTTAPMTQPATQPATR
jgi:hypothetical protein